MAQKFKSPGVFTTEVDQSFVPAGGPGVGAVLIGRTKKGPAFVPFQVSNFDQFRSVFGEVDSNLDLPYAAKNYLANGDSLTVMRVLGHADGTTTNSGYTVGGVTGISDTSGSVSVTGSVLAVIHHSGTISVVSVTGVAGDANNFVFKVGSVFAATASFVTSSANYVEKVLNTDPTKYSTYGHYLAAVYKYQKPAASASWFAVGITSASFIDFKRDFEGGATSWIKSQLLGGQEFDLFRFLTTAHGRATNDDVKVMIANVKQSSSPSTQPYGTFDVVVRSFYDTDLRPVVLETFTQLTLDPNDKNYIARRIGDSYESFDTQQRKFISVGTYPSKSNYIRVEMATTNIPSTALPWGFRGFPKAAYSGSSTIGANKVPDLPYVQVQKDQNGNYNSNVCWGVQFLSGGIVDRMRALPDALVPGTSTAYLTASDADFSLRYLSGTYDSSGQMRYAYDTVNGGTYDSIFASASLQKFVVPFKGGHDGWDLRVTDPLYLQNSDDTTQIGVVSLMRAVDCVRNPDYIDFNMVAIPSVHNLRVTDYCRAMVNERGDSIYIMDITGSSVSEAINGIKNREIDDNYTACYYPDVKVNDTVNNAIARVAPSAVVLGAIAYNDKVGQVFFAPAGMTRGGLSRFDVIDTVDRLRYEDRNDLYEARINPIATFPTTGISIQGQKTLQLRASALDRINVRRLLLLAKRLVVAATKDLVFEPDNPATWQRFTNKVNPILEKIRQDQGLERFKVVMDTTTNTSDVIDRNIMVGKIYLQPTKTAEYLDLSFIVSPSGVTFGS